MKRTAPPFTKLPKVRSTFNAFLDHCMTSRITLCDTFHLTPSSLYARQALVQTRPRRPRHNGSLFFPASVSLPLLDTVIKKYIYIKSISFFFSFFLSFFSLSFTVISLSLSLSLALSLSLSLAFFFLFFFHFSSFFFFMHVIVGVNLNNMHPSSGVIIYPFIHLFTHGLNTVYIYIFFF